MSCGERYGRARWATDNSIARRMRFACWITQAKNKHVLIFHGNNGYANAPQCYVIRILPLLIKGAYDVFSQVEESRAVKNICT